MVQLYLECPNCGNRLFYTKSAATKIPGEGSWHYCHCHSCGYQNDFRKLEKSMTYA